MCEQYAHLLIANRVDFAPQPEKIADFLERLIALKSAPLGATLRVGKLSGTLRTGLDSLTGEKIFLQKRAFISLESVFEIGQHLAGLEDYDVLLSGRGPAKLPLFPLYTMRGSEWSEFEGPYAYEVRCCLRAEAVSTCETPPFGTPYLSEKRTGVFRHPYSGAIIEVRNAGCARFWIEFEFGKWLFPKIANSLNLLQPPILANAVDTFGTGFAQGCLCR
jgi:hypothetical protein